MYVYLYILEFIQMSFNNKYLTIKTMDDDIKKNICLLILNKLSSEYAFI